MSQARHSEFAFETVIEAHLLAAGRVASGVDDPFHPGVEKLVSVLPSGSTVVFSAGCHTDSFFLEQEPPSLAFLSRQLT